jgi:hypothetical protein
MGIKIAIMFFLLGFMMNGIFTLRVQAILDREVPESDVQQLLNTSQQRDTETAQNDETKETKKNEPILDSEQKRRTTEPAKPKNTTTQKKGPPKDFVPSEKIPADQAVDFPTDI